MTTAQRFLLIIDNPRKNHVCLWTQACRVMGWDKSDRDLRLSEFSKAVGRPLASSSDLGKMDDVTKVKKHLEALIHPADMERQLAGVQMARTNLLVRIAQFDPALVNHLLKQRFTFAVWLRQTHPDFTGATISRKSRHPAPEWIVAEYRDAAPHAPTLDDLDENELEQLRNTLVREAHGKKVTAPKVESEPEAVTVNDGDPDWNV